MFMYICRYRCRLSTETSIYRSWHSNVVNCRIFKVILVPSINLRSRHVEGNYHRSAINMTKWEMSSCNWSKNVHRNFCRSSNNMAKCEIFSFTRSRLVYMEFSIDLLVTWKNVMFAFNWSRHLYGNLPRSSSNMKNCEMFSYKRSRRTY